MIFEAAAEVPNQFKPFLPVPLRSTGAALLIQLLSEISYHSNKFSDYTARHNLRIRLKPIEFESSENSRIIVYFGTITARCRLKFSQAIAADFGRNELQG